MEGAGNAETAAQKKAPRKVIIDTDPGIDDYFALLLALASTDELEVLGITVIAGGNGKDVHRLALNACSALHLCGRDDIKVIKGASTSLTGVDHGDSGLQVHGRVNGLGNVDLPACATSTRPMEHSHASAAHYLVETCQAHSGAVTLIALGPLTNIAEALRLSPGFSATVDSLVIMGGTVQGGQWAEYGNKAPTAEANIHNDPEAAKLVFQNFPSITMAGLNVTHQLDMITLRERLQTVNEAGRLLHKISEHYVALLKSWGYRSIAVHDPSAILALINPDLFETAHVFVDVETKGELTSGQTVADWRGHWGKKPQTTVLMRVDKARAEDLMVERIAKLSFPDLGELRVLPE